MLQQPAGQAGLGAGADRSRAGTIYAVPGCWWQRVPPMDLAGHCMPRRIWVPGPRLAALPCLPQALLAGLPALALLVWLWAPNAPALPVKGGPDPAGLLATSICREKIKLLTVLPFLSLY